VSLIEHRPEGLLRVRWVRTDAIGVEDATFSTSFLLTPERLVADWAPASIDDLDDAALEQVLALQPELVLLGSGSRQRFPTQAVFATFLRRRIGFEVMDNAAAARTYHLLAQEGRRVLAAFLLPG
jgi:uncharacterized protein